MARTLSVTVLQAVRLIAVVAVSLACVASALRAAASQPVEEQVASILSLSADAAYGEYLAGDCVTCHRRSGGGPGIPPIAGLPAAHVARALVEYRLGLRDNEVMTVRAVRLGDEEIAALSAYFAAQTP